MESKNGFTLIELLAVIVILSIILIIAVPKVLEVIEHADMMAYKDSVELMIHQAKIQYQMSEMQGTEKELPIVYNYEYDEIKKQGKQVSSDVEVLNFKGDKPRDGSITLTENKKVKVQKLVSKNNKWCAIKEENSNLRVGRTTDSSFNCVQSEDQIVEDKVPCELELSEETIDGIKTNVYYIDSESDLYALSLNVSGGKDYLGEKIVLRNNLNMSKYTNDEIKTQCNNTSIIGFEPIGTKDHPFKGEFDGGAKTISNLTIDMTSPKTNQTSRGFDGVAGLFGYTNGTRDNQVKIYGLIMDNITIKGKIISGGVVAYIRSYATIKDMVLKNIKVISNTKGYTSGGVFGSTDGNETINNIIMMDSNIEGDYAGFLSNSYSSIRNSIVSNSQLKYKSSKDNQYETMLFTNNCKIQQGTNASYNHSNGLTTEDFNDINQLESIGMDTYIGGDDDSSGYYFDYDNSGKIQLVKVSGNSFNLSMNKDSNDNYLITNEKEWKMATAHLSEKYKITNSLDFSNNKYYMMGSETNPFKGTFDGDMKQIKNVTINASKGIGVGLFGYINNADLKKIYMSNINIKGGQRVGGLAGRQNGTVYLTTIKLKEININGKDPIASTGGVVGFNEGGTIKLDEIELDNVNITSSSDNATAGLFAFNNSSIYYSNILLKNVKISGKKFLYGLASIASNAIIENITIDATTDNTIRSAIDVNNDNRLPEWQIYLLNYKITKNKGTTSEITLSNTNNPNVDNLDYYTGKIETAYDGDKNNSGYFFDTTSDGKVHLVKAYSKTNAPSGSLVSSTDTTMIYDNDPNDNDNPPTCTLKSLTILNDGFRPLVECNDDVAIQSFRSLYDSRPGSENPKKVYTEIGTDKQNLTWTNSNKTITFNGAWRRSNIYDTPLPVSGLCYYFRYGAMDTKGNYCTYVSSQCFSF